jgi:hypothetical protein
MQTNSVLSLGLENETFTEADAVRLNPKAGRNRHSRVPLREIRKHSATVIGLWTIQRRRRMRGAGPIPYLLRRTVLNPSTGLEKTDAPDFTGNTAWNLPLA